MKNVGKNRRKGDHRERLSKDVWVMSCVASLWDARCGR